jgi:hypothetical protein
MHWAIEYYMTADGKCPVREFIDGLSHEGQAKFIFITKLLIEYGVLVKEPYVKQFTGHKKLFEMRIKDETGISRILYFTIRKEIHTPAWIYEKDEQDSATRYRNSLKG